MKITQLNSNITIEDVEERLINSPSVIVLHSHGLLPSFKNIHHSCDDKDVIEFAFSFDSKESLKHQLSETLAQEKKLIVIASYYQSWIQQWLSESLNLSYLDDYITLEHIEMIGLPDIARGVGKSFNLFVEENKKGFESVYYSLADQASKDLYQKLINFRINHFSISGLSHEQFPLSKEEQIKIEKNATTFEEAVINKSPEYLASNVAFKLSVDEYTYQDKISLSNKKSILNCGAYNNSSVVFSILSPEANIYAFEPQESVHIENIETARKLTNIFPVNLGLWSHQTRLYFNTRIDASGSTTGSKLVKEATENTDFIDVTSIDEYVRDNQVSLVDFIKMDVEGAELEALDGAINVIKTFKPDLAISIYHEPEHLFKIPLKIKELLPEYSIYIDQRYVGVCETVCFATVN